MKKGSTILYLRTKWLSKGTVAAGGHITHTIEVIKGFLNLGMHVYCASSFAPEALKKLGCTKFVRLAKFGTRLLGFHACLLISNFIHLFQLRSFFKMRGKIDYIYQRSALMNFLGVAMSKVLRAPLIIEFNGSEADADVRWGSSASLFRFFKVTFALENLCLRRARYIVVVSEELQQELVVRGIATEKILINPNGVDIDFFNAQKLRNEREKIREEYRLSKRFVFGFVGNFFPWHGINIFKKLIPEIVSKHSQAHFLFIGDGWLRQELEEYCKKLGIMEKHVTFTGLLPQNEARKYLAACDAYLLPCQPTGETNGKPSFYGSPTKVFEYMSMGKPCIVSDLGQLKHVVSPARVFKETQSSEEGYGKLVGFRVHYQDVQGFVEACSLLLDNEGMVNEQVGVNARKKVESNFTWLDHIRRISDFVSDHTNDSV